jgi:hypothetical protein
MAISWESESQFRIFSRSPMRRYPGISADVLQMLERIEPSVEGPDLRYYPCAATLKSGTVMECVYLCEPTPWFALWGVWPEDDPGKQSISVEDIAELRESTYRLPARFANRLYRAGESGMGYTIFVVEFRDGTRAAYGTGNAVDFITYPPGQSAATVVKVLPHEGRMEQKLSTPDFTWCLFERLKP